MLDYKKSSFYLECCDADGLVISNYEDFVSINHSIKSFYGLQENLFRKIYRRLNILWNVVILGREFALYEILIGNPKILQNFKNYVNSLEIKVDSE